VTSQRLGLGPSCVTLGLERFDAANAAALPAVPVDAAGLSREDRITVLFGYARELCLYDRDDIAEKACSSRASPAAPTMPRASPASSAGRDRTRSRRSSGCWSRP
jgi:hypothetical protein